MSANTYLEYKLRPEYRPDIDGLRAIAILSVVIFHAFPSQMRGGFVGVDIFFVISGYLISGIILRSLENGEFNFAQFYAQRIKRIFPALSLVLIACFCIGWLVLLPDEYKQLGKHIAAGAGYVQNFVLMSEAGYFDGTSESKPLMHLWSLAIEEQFYVVYPLIIWACWRGGINLLLAVIVFFVLSFVANIWGVSKDAVDTFFLPQTRVWELLAGSILAFIPLFKRDSWLTSAFGSRLLQFLPSLAGREREFNNALSLTGFLLIIAAAFGIDKTDAFPGWLALLPVAGSFALIFAGPMAIVNRLVLTNRPIIFVGLISYPLYLWHWPVLSFTHIIEGKVPSVEVRSFAVISSFILAWMTYRLVEKPVRFGNKSWVKNASLVVLTMAIGSAGFYTFYQDGLGFRVEKFVKVSKAAGEWSYPGSLAREEFNGVQFFAHHSRNPKTTLFVGDSNIEQYYPRIDELLQTSPERTNSTIFKTGGGCFPVPNMSYDEPHAHCRTLMHEALDIAVNMHEVRTVVIGGQWNGYFAGGFGLTEKIQYGDPAYRMALSKLSTFIRTLIGKNKNVFVVLNIPTGHELDPKYIAQRGLDNFPNIWLREGGVDKSLLDKTYGKIQADLARTAMEAGAEVINPADFLCGERCRSLDDEGEPMYKDAKHLRPYYVRRHVKFIDKTVQQ